MTGVGVEIGMLFQRSISDSAHQLVDIQFGARGVHKCYLVQLCAVSASTAVKKFFTVEA